MPPHNAPTVPWAGAGVLQQGRGEDEWPDDVKQSSRFRATNPSSVLPGGELKKGRPGREGIKPKPARLRKIFPILGSSGTCWGKAWDIIPPAFGYQGGSRG